MKTLFLWLAASVLYIFASGIVVAESASADAYGTMIKLGKNAQGTKNHGLALNAYSKAAHLKPKDPLAHLLLVETLVLAGRQRRAEAYLHALIKRPEQTANAPVYQTALGQLQAKKRLAFSGSFVLKPSSNVNNVASDKFFDTLLGRFDIENGGDEKFGFGLELGGKVIHRTPLANGRRVELGADLRRGLYEQDHLRYWHLRLAADLKSVGAQVDWGIGAYAARKTYSGDPNNSGELFSYGVHGHHDTFLSNHRRLSFRGVIEQRRYLRAETLSGPYFRLGSTLKMLHNRGATSFYSLDLERRRTNLDYHRYWGIGLLAGYETNVTEDLRLGINAGLTIRNYDTNFASVNFARQDRVLKVGFSATNKKIKFFGATPKLNCSYEKQKSNVALYSKNTTECQIGWFYSF